MKVTIFGLGYVGSVTAACLARAGHDVTGIDLDPVKVKSINDAKCPIIEPELDDLIADAVSAGKLNASDQVQQLGDISLVCVGTPSQGNGSLGLDQIRRVIAEIGELIKKHSGYHVVTVRSTVLPGTVEEELVPILETHSGRKAGRDFGVCMTPEFLRESTAVRDFYNPPFTVVGAADARAGQLVSQLFASVEAPLELVPVKVAEMIKYACNAFHALKITFANEIGNLSKSVGIDSHEVMRVFCRDDKLNLSPYYLKPGFAFGGSCLPKDLRALIHKGRHNELNLPLIESVLASNVAQMNRAFQLIRDTGRKRIGFLGLSFKPGTDDLRESPVVELIETLIGKGYSVLIYDKEVSLARIYGANKRYIEHTIPHVSSLMKDTIEEVVDQCDVIVAAKKTGEFAATIRKVDKGKVVVDLVRLFPALEELPPGYHGICW